jgi:hypothetical protein
MILTGTATIDHVAAAMKPQASQLGSLLSGSDRNKSGTIYHANEINRGTSRARKIRNKIGLILEMNQAASITIRQIGM